MSRAGGHESRPRAAASPQRGTRFEPQPRPCAGPRCDSDTFEPGELCGPCRASQGQVSATWVQSTVADAIRRLDKLREDGPAPLALPLAQALSDMRRAYDAIEPMVYSFQIGVVQVERNEFWAFPDVDTRLGPFGKRGHAERALVSYAHCHLSTSDSEGGMKR